jgi:hypothetical protein
MLALRIKVLILESGVAMMGNKVLQWVVGALLLLPLVHASTVVEDDSHWVVSSDKVILFTWFFYALLWWMLSDGC